MELFYIGTKVSFVCKHLGEKNRGVPQSHRGVCVYVRKTPPLWDCGTPPRRLVCVCSRRFQCLQTKLRFMCVFYISKFPHPLQLTYAYRQNLGLYIILPLRSVSGRVIQGGTTHKIIEKTPQIWYNK